MSTPKIPDPALLFLSVLCARWEEIWPQLEPSLEGHFGPAAYVSDLIPFTQTRYYDEELGTPIYRRVLAFETLLPHDRLAWAKLLTNALERRFTSAGGNRLVNLDPGLVSPGAARIGDRQEFHAPHLSGARHLGGPHAYLHRRGLADPPLDVPGLCRPGVAKTSEHLAGTIQNAPQSGENRPKPPGMTRRFRLARHPSPC